MADTELREAERAWRSSPTDHLVERALVAHERARRDPPWDLIAASPRWRAVRGFIRKWYDRPLEPSDGCTPDEVARADSRLGVRLPTTVREWYLLAGRWRDRWGFNRLDALETLKLETGHLRLGAGHQGVCEWLARVDDGLVHVHGSWGRERERVGAANDFYLAFLIEEFAWTAGGGRLGSMVRHATYWNVHDVGPAARRTFRALPVAPLVGNVSGRDALGDADTLVVVVDPEPIYVAARTEEAWLAVRRALGDPRDEDVRGPAAG